VADLTVAVLTFRRNVGLRDLLPMLIAEVDVLSTRTGMSGEILVVDNDPEGGGRKVATAVDDGRVRYVHEPTPGIPPARNRALDEASSSALLAFIDDDERPVAGWLSNLVETHQQSGAAAVTGPVESVFDGELDPWIANGGFFRRVHNLGRVTGDVVPAAATNNLLLDMTTVRRLGLRFDVSLGMAGGEDTLFTRQMVAAGGPIVWCAQARVTDHVPAERMTRRFVLGRVRAQANASAAAAIRAAGGPGARARARTRSAVAGAARMVGGALRAAVGTILRRDDHQAAGLATAVRGLGSLAAAFGHRLEEYGRRAAP